MNEYRDIRASLLRNASNFAADFGMKAINLEAHATPQSWPLEDFIGVDEIQITTQEKMLHVTGAFVISTREDVNLDRLEERVNSLVNQIYAGAKMVIYSVADNTPRGHLIVQTGVRVGSVLHTEVQPARPVFFQMVSDQTLSPA